MNPGAARAVSKPATPDGDGSAVAAGRGAAVPAGGPAAAGSTAPSRRGTCRRGARASRIGSRAPERPRRRERPLGEVRSSRTTCRPRCRARVQRLGSPAGDREQCGGHAVLQREQIVDDAVHNRRGGDRARPHLHQPRGDAQPLAEALIGAAHHPARPDGPADLDHAAVRVRGCIGRGQGAHRLPNLLAAGRLHRRTLFERRGDRLGDACADPVVGRGAADIDELRNSQPRGLVALGGDTDRREPADKNCQRDARRSGVLHGSVDADPCPPV